MVFSRTTLVALLAVERAKATGVFEVVGEDATLRLTIERGAPVFASFSGEESAAYSIGEVLIAREAINVVAYAKALQQNPPVAPIGTWLVESGSTSRRKLNAALAEQMIARVAKGLSLVNARTEFLEGRRATQLDTVDGITIADLLVSAVRRVAPNDTLAKAPRRLAITRVGRELVKQLTMGEEARQVVSLLTRAPMERDVLRASISQPETKQMIGALITVGAIGSATTAPYRLLLRKHREVEKSAAPQVLLELPRAADRNQARRALRRFAKELHPDRFSEHDEAVRQTSREVMRALVDAEARWDA